MSPNKPSRRHIFERKFLINPAFQIRFMGYSMGISLAVIAAIFLTSEYFFWNFADQGRNAGLADSDIYFVFLHKQRLAMNRALIVLSIFCSLILALWGLFLSHRVAGPLFRLNRHMQTVAGGRSLSPILFRKKDFFKELAESYNRQYHFLTELQQVEVSATDGILLDSEKACS